MLRFDVYNNGAPAKDIDLGGAYVFGQDAIPVRADLAAHNGQVQCMKRVPGASGLALVWDAGAAGRFLMPTTRLPERAKSYNLNVELARAQLMRIAQKREDWGLFDYPEAAPLNERFAEVRKDFVAALKADDPAQGAALADQTLEEAMTLGEQMSLFHADILIARRKATGGPAWRPSFGCMIDLFSTAEEYQERLREAFGFVSLPMAWKHVEPKERQYQHKTVDSWVNWAAHARKPIQAGPLISFEQMHLPEWLYIWENDYESLRDMIYEHVQRIVQRYKRQVGIWNVVSGIHAHNNFNLSFEQLMELTRMTCLLVKKLVPRAQVMIELVMPWGEYYARNQRTIPPMLYADMAVQSGIKFDAFGVKLLMGVPQDGLYVRDLMQISALLDEFVSFGKPLHITACQVPSDVTPDAWDAWGGRQPVPKAGLWHQHWSQRLQAEWLQAFYRIAISKPFIDSICWRDLADYEGHYIPHGGLCRNDMEPKLAYKELRRFRISLISGTPTPGEDTQPVSDQPPQEPAPKPEPPAPPKPAPKTKPPAAPKPAKEAEPPAVARLAEEDEASAVAKLAEEDEASAVAKLVEEPQPPAAQPMPPGPTRQPPQPGPQDERS